MGLCQHCIIYHLVDSLKSQRHRIMPDNDHVFLKTFDSMPPSDELDPLVCYAGEGSDPLAGCYRHDCPGIRLDGSYPFLD